MKNKKLDFKKPKYVIPIIALPFLIFINFVMQGFSSGGSENIGVTLETKEEINTSIPEPSQKSTGGLQDKFGSYLQQFKDTKEYSAINTLEEEKSFQDDLGGDLYTEEEIKKLDSINNLNSLTQRLRRQRESEISEYRKQVEGENVRSSYRNTKTAEEQEREAFIEQMRIIDSIQNPDKYIVEEETLIDDSLKMELVENREKTFLISSDPAANNSLFNANIRGKKNQEIKAILDEGLTVYQGSRVRIRLLTDVYIDEHLIEKGSYLYGIVSGFSSQRVQVSIRSVVIGEKIFPINVTVYNNDGIPGFYVPESKFREIANQLGANMVSNSNSLGQQSPSISSGNAEAERQRFMYDMINGAYRTASTTVKNVLRKNKAHLKYNTVVFLINENEQ